jgi:hypothetical protein
MLTLVKCFVNKGWRRSTLRRPVHLCWHCAPCLERHTATRRDCMILWLFKGFGCDRLDDTFVGVNLR